MHGSFYLGLDGLLMLQIELRHDTLLTIQII